MKSILGNIVATNYGIFRMIIIKKHSLFTHSGSGGATGRTGEDTSPPVLFKVNFLICPNPVRKMGGGYVCDISPVI
jgi:hypothetical protein